jgi:hypothetical protein
VHGEEHLLRSAIARIEGDGYFMASVLAAYRHEFQTGDSEIARLLNCGPEDLVNLALCRTPRMEDDKEFASDIQAIAQYADCDWLELAKLTRTVQSISTLRRLGEGSQKRLLKAARPKRATGLKSRRPRRKT